MKPMKSEHDDGALMRVFPAEDYEKRITLESINGAVCLGIEMLSNYGELDSSFVSMTPCEAEEVALALSAFAYMVKVRVA